jgi:ankyrin repeat protein
VKTPNSRLVESERRPGTFGWGVLYEKELLMLGLHRAIDKNYDFMLDTNLKTASDFDDVVLTRKETINQVETEARLCLQVKHKENVANKITYIDLFKPKHDFSLIKYFYAYLEAKQNFDHQKPGRNSLYFVIYTNVDFNCPDPGALFRTHRNRNSNTEYLIFKRLETQSSLLSLFDTKHQNTDTAKKPEFYQLAEQDAQQNDEKTRVLQLFNGILNADPKLQPFYAARLDQAQSFDDWLQEMLSDYTKKLVFAVDQPDAKALEQIIKNEIDPTLTDIEKQVVFQYTLNTITNWKESPKAYPLIRDDNLFLKARHRLQQLHSISPTFTYQTKITNTGFQFNHALPLSGFLSAPQKILHILSTHTFLSTVYVYRSVHQFDNDAGVTPHTHLFLKLSKFMKQPDTYLNAFMAETENLLVLECQTDAVSQDLIHQISGRLESDALFTSNPRKKIILIGASDNHFITTLQGKFSTQANDLRTLGFNDFTGPTQQGVLDKQVLLLGQSLPIRDLFPETRIDLIDAVLEKIILKQREFIKLYPILKATSFQFNDLAARGKELILNKEISFEQNKVTLAELIDTTRISIDTVLDKLVLQDEIHLSELYQTFKEHDLKITWDDFTTHGKEVLLSKKVSFQGKSIALSQLITPSQTIDADALNELITHPALTIGQGVSKLSQLQAAYHKVTTLLETDRLKQAIAENVDDLFVFDGNYKDVFEANPRVFMLSSPIKQEKQFKDIVDNYPEKTIHWIKKQGEFWNWIQYYDPNFYLNRHFELSNEDPAYVTHPKLSEQALLALDRKVTIIADEAGMGKSTTLTRFATQLKSQHPTAWVINLDLKACETDLSEHLDVVNKETFLAWMDEIYLKSAHVLEKNLFQNRVYHPSSQIFLLLDGFDEIQDPAHQQIIIQLLQFIQNTRIYFYISTRPYQKTTLEKALSTPAMVFESFDLTQQEDYLIQFWRKSLKLKFDSVALDVLPYQAYANALLTQAQSVLNDINMRFMGIPLQMRMLVENFEQDFEKFCSEPDALKTLSTRFESVDLLGLYQCFIQRKFQIYVNEKETIIGKSSQRNLFKSYTSNHRFIALKLLFPNQDINFIALGIHTPKAFEDFETLKETVNRIGLAQYLEEHIEFVHRSFAEYLVADTFMEFLKTNSQDQRVWSFLLKVILVDDRNYVIRRFLDSSLAKQDLKQIQVPRSYIETAQSTKRNQPLHRVVQENLPRILELLLSPFTQDGSALKQLLLIKSQKDKTVLHIASGLLDQNNEIIQILLRFVNQDTLKAMLLARDSRGRTPIHIAITCYQYKSGNDLLNVDKEDPRLLNYILPLTFSDQIEILSMVDREGRTILHLATPPVLMSLQKHKEVLAPILNRLSLVQDQDGMTPIHITSYHHGRLYLDTLLSFVSKSDFKKLLALEDKLGMTPLSAIIMEVELLSTFLASIDAEQFAAILEIQELKLHGQALLHQATIFGNPAIVELLLKQEQKFPGILKPALTIKDFYGRLALHYVGVDYEGHFSSLNIIKNLLSLFNNQDELKQHLLTQDNEGYTPLHCVATRSEPKESDVPDLIRSDAPHLVTGLLEKVKIYNVPDLIKLDAPELIKAMLAKVTDLADLYDRLHQLDQARAARANLPVGTFQKLPLPNTSREAILSEIIRYIEHQPQVSISAEQRIQLQKNDQNLFKHLDQIWRNIPGVKRTAVTHPMSRMNKGQCVGITRIFSQLLFLDQHQTFLANLKTAHDLSQIKQKSSQGISAQETETLKQFYKTIKLFRSTGNIEHSLPQDLSSFKTIEIDQSLQNYLETLTGDFAIHLVSFNHVVAIYRKGDTYSFFDTNVIYASGVPDIPTLVKMVAQAINQAGYSLQDNQLSVEYFDVTQANAQLTPAQKQILTTPIQTERQRLKQQDQTLGTLTLDKHPITRVQLYDLGAQIKSQETVPSTRINAAMKLDQEQFNQIIQTKRIVLTPQDYFDTCRKDPTHKLIQITNNIPFSDAASQETLDLAQKIRTQGYFLQDSSSNNFFIQPSQTTQRSGLDHVTTQDTRNARFLR